jgi:hypothetical protein
LTTQNSARIATEAADFKIEVAHVERVTECGRRLVGSLRGDHALGLRLAGELVGLPARLSSALGRDADRGAVKPTAGFAWPGSSKPP